MWQNYKRKDWRQWPQTCWQQILSLEAVMCQNHLEIYCKYSNGKIERKIYPLSSHVIPIRLSFLFLNIENKWKCVTWWASCASFVYLDHLLKMRSRSRPLSQNALGRKGSNALFVWKMNQKIYLAMRRFKISSSVKQSPLFKTKAENAPHQPISVDMFCYPTWFFVKSPVIRPYFNCVLRTHQTVKTFTKSSKILPEV